MNTKIVDTIRLWVSDSAEFVGDIGAEHSSIQEYQLLEHLAQHCVSLLAKGTATEQERARGIIKVINLLYQEGNQYTRNAIENEFLTHLAAAESPGSLREHMELFPTELRKGYIKTILEN